MPGKNKKLTVTIIGLGLLGTSLGQALNGKYRRVAWARRKESRDFALKYNAADAVFDTPDQALRFADVAVICLPVKNIISFIHDNANLFKKKAIVTDIGSVKGEIVQKLFTLLKKKNIEFIGSHPMAGSERSGAEAAFPEIYKDSSIYLTPLKKNTKKAIATISKLWRTAGGKVILIDPDEHDRLVAITSHLVHISAACLASSVLDCSNDDFAKRANACAGGFKDSTRIAVSSPEMWEEIIEFNAKNIIPHLSKMESRLAEMRVALEKRDFSKVGKLLKKSAELKRKLSNSKNKLP
jgi:prephenate dehydrogenase